uniref:Uncharacterized protein n=1 Tax=Ananas comosus var. bracteatus TaxID=296719 RepID=A0A6V7NNI1_ANACO|nr:unnamed protein product [Ananas comosus var. bracteatus]
MHSRSLQIQCALSRHVDNSTMAVEDWHMKSHHVLQRSRKAYEKRGASTRTYKTRKARRWWSRTSIIRGSTKSASSVRHRWRAGGASIAPADSRRLSSRDHRKKLALIWVKIELSSTVSCSREQRREKRGWFAAFVADVLYNVFSGGKKQPEYSSYGYSDVHPRQIQYAPSPKSSNRYSSEDKRRDEKRVSSKEERRDAKHASRHVDYSKTVVEDWHMKSPHMLQRRTAYEERGVATRTYKDSKGKDVVEQKQYHVKKYEEHQLSPARTESRRGSKHRSR